MITYSDHYKFRICRKNSIIQQDHSVYNQGKKDRKFTTISNLLAITCTIFKEDKYINCHLENTDKM